MKHTVDDIELKIEPEFRTFHNRVGVFNTHFQNFGHYNIPKAQLILADPPYCYDEETECFTRNGWKRYTELNYDDELLSLNHETQEMCYSGIDAIIIRDNDEDMISFSSCNLNLFVSAKHRCYTINDFAPNLKFGERLRNRKRVHKENITLAKDVSIAAYIPKSGYKWKSMSSQKSIIIPSCTFFKNKTKSVELPQMEFPLEKWLPFFGLWLADGCTAKEYTVSIKQFGVNRNMVRQVLDNLGLKYCEYKEKDREASNFDINSKQLYQYLRQFGKSKDKYIPRWILDLDIEYLRLFWEWYTFGDSTKNGKGIKISSVSKRLIEGLQEVALKLGVLCQVRSQSHEKWTNTLYSFQFNSKSKNIRYCNKQVVSDYKGKVWCVTLRKNSVFLVRRRGIITFSGNCIGKNAYASNPSWYKDGDNKNGESELAGEEFFDTDKDFRPAEFMHFCSQMLRPEPKEKGKAPCMIIFCGWEQQFYYKELGERYGFNGCIPLVFRKNYSAQVLKANMKVVGNCEYGLILYRDKLPKFNNHGEMVMNCMEFPRDLGMPRSHPTQKHIPLLKKLIGLFTDPDDVVIDPTAGSCSSIVAAASMQRKAYGFEIKKQIYSQGVDNVKRYISNDLFEVSPQLEKRKQYTQASLF